MLQRHHHIYNTETRIFGIAEIRVSHQLIRMIFDLTFSIELSKINLRLFLSV